MLEGLTAEKRRDLDVGGVPTEYLAPPTLGVSCFCALAAVSTRPRLGFIIVVAVAAWTIAAHALHLPGLHDMSVLTNLFPPAVWDSSLVGFVKLALLGDHK